MGLSGGSSRHGGGKRPERRASRAADPHNAVIDAPATADAIDSYSAALAYLHNRINLEKEAQSGATRSAYRLDRMRALCKALGDPQEAVRSVHIAGTKGKGSTCEMTAAALEGCGYTVGIYTSPHVSDIRERIRVNRRMISEATFIQLIRDVGRAAESLASAPATAPATGPATGPASPDAPASPSVVTFFEMMTAMAFLHFAQDAVDVAVIEVGLGGLLDCTNIITPEVAAVTTIGFDHMAILGDTLEEIALQKAGIFKPGVPALTINQEPGVIAAMEGYAQKVAAPFFVVGRDIDFAHRAEYPVAPRATAPADRGTGPIIRVSVSSERNNFEHFAVPLKGEHQALNCGLALAILDKLTERGFSCPPDKVARGLERVSLPGRFELVCASPRIILDGAHNPESMRALMKAMSANMSYDSLTVVFGIASDKDIPGSLRPLAQAADKVIFTRATGNARAARPGELARTFHEISGKHAMTCPDLADAMELAVRGTNREDVICVTGSFYLLGEAKAWLAAKLAKKK